MTSSPVPPRVIGIGASAGGIDALLSVMRALPADFPHAVCVTLHLSATARSHLAQILDRRSAVGVTVARHRARLRPGCVYVAPPDCHLLVKDGLIELSRGPKENGMRPAIDTMLRSIAEQGPRAVAVVLSGALGDGSGGARLVLQAGGDVFVQEPGDATVSSMPERAIALVDGGARVLRAEEIGVALAALPSRPDGEEKGVGMDPSSGRTDPSRRRPEGPASGLTCPECSGALWELRDGEVLRYRCRIGHSYSDDAMVVAQGTALEAALWAALEMLEERAEFLRGMAERRAVGNESFHRRLTAAATDADARAELIRSALSGLPGGEDAFSVSSAADG
jgi:two-component system chemotaxis response regulator CheB